MIYFVYPRLRKLSGAARLILELANLLAERRLADVQALRRSSKVQLLSDSDDVPEMTKFHEALIRVKS